MNHSLRRMGLLLLLIPFMAPSVDDARAGEFHLNMTNGLVSGESLEEEMGKVMEALAEKTGITVYLDQDLEKTPVTFRLAEEMPPELAVRRIVKPFSFVLFMEDDAGHEAAIREIWIFRKGSPQDARYRVYTAQASPPPSIAALPSGGPAGTDGAVGGGRVINGRDLFPQKYDIRRSPFGSPVIQPRMTGKAPGPWPDPAEMKRAHAARQSQQKMEHDRKQQAVRRELHRKEQQRQKEWQDRRNRDIREIINQKEGPNDPADSPSE